MKDIKQYRVHFEGYIDLFALSENDVKEYIKKARYFLEDADYYNIVSIKEIEGADRIIKVERDCNENKN